MNKKWKRGNVGRFWDDSFKSFDYIRQPITEEEINAWQNQGYDYVKSFTGSMYDNSCPMPDWVKRFDSIFNYKNMTYTFYKMQTLEIMPVHVDHYKRYRELYDAEYESVCRILVMLEDWKPGHYLEIDGVGIVNWIAGDWFMWNTDCPHAASNIGVDNRYTLQITATIPADDKVWKDLHWFNIPHQLTKVESLYTPTMHYIFNHALNINKGNPLFIYMYNQNIKQLEDINHSPQTINYLNEKGIDFYLFEPLCSYDIKSNKKYPLNSKHSCLFYTEFSHHIEKNAMNLRADELDSILEYASRNNLINITVHTCDYNVEKFYPYYDRLKLKCNDLFLRVFDLIEFGKPQDIELAKNFTKKFISLNWRYTPHRQYISAYLAQLENVNLTWYFRADITMIAREPWIDLFTWPQKNGDLLIKFLEGLKNINNKSPYTLDLNIKESINITDPYIRNNWPNGVIFDYKKETQNSNISDLSKYYNEVFCDIVCESRYAQPTANYSEKVYRPMFYYKPFILVAPPYTLKYLKEQGFKTFDKYWDETYDLITDHEQRLFKIIELIDYIDAKPFSELKEMYLDMQEILIHNFNILREKCPPHPME